MQESVYSAPLEATPWGLTQISIFLLPKNLFQPLIPAGAAPVVLDTTHSKMRHFRVLNLATGRGWGGHTCWTRSGRSGLSLMGAHAAQHLHILSIRPLAPHFRQAAFLGHMGGVWLRGPLEFGPSGMDLSTCTSPGGTVVPDGLFHLGSRPHHPSQTAFLYIELIITSILYYIMPLYYILQLLLGGGWGTVTGMLLPVQNSRQGCGV